jgi:DNA-binding response OmpR family regulator
MQEEILGQHPSRTVAGQDAEDCIQNFIRRIHANLQSNMPELLTLSRDSQAARLLIVDDEPGIRLALVRALGLLGYTVDGAGSGQEALALLERIPYGLMVLDMHMPGIDGVEVMHRARQQCPELLIIVLTGYATIDSAIAAVKLEAVDYLRKPVGIREIADTVTQVLQKQAKQQHRRCLMQAMARALDALREVETPRTAPPNMVTSSKRFVNSSSLTLDRQNRRVAIEDNPVQTLQLTEGETAVLASLMTRPNQALSCRELAHLTWDQNLSESEAESVVRPYIFRLRQKLEANPKSPRLICTVRNQGYLFISKSR